MYGFSIDLKEGIKIVKQLLINRKNTNTRKKNSQKESE